MTTRGQQPASKPPEETAPRGTKPPAEAEETALTGEQVTELKPSWVAEEDTKFKWTEEDALVAQAYLDLFGREIDQVGLAEARATDLSVEKHIAQLASSAEARKRGIKPEDYGAELVDLGGLKPKEKEFYDVWTKANPGQAFYTTDLNTIRWEMDATGGDVRGYQAKQAGLIRQDAQYDPKKGTVTGFMVAPQEAIDFMGGSMLYSGSRAGDLFYVPAGTKFRDKDAIDFVEGGPDERGFVTAYGIGNSTGALLGDVIGDKNAEKLAGYVPDFAKLALDPWGLYGSWAFDTDWQKDAAGSLEGLGVDAKYVQAAQDIGLSMVQTALTATGLGTAAAVGLEVAQQANLAKSNRTSLSEAFKTAAWNSASMVASSYLLPADAGAVRSALTAGGITTAISGAKDGDWSQAARDGFYSAAGSLISSGMSASLGKWAPGVKQSRLINTGLGAAGSVASTALRMETDKSYAQMFEEAGVDTFDAYRDAAVQGAVSGALRGVSSGEKYKTFSETFSVDPRDAKGLFNANVGSEEWKSAEINTDIVSALKFPYKPIGWAAGKIGDAGAWAKDSFVDIATGTK